MDMKIKEDFLKLWNKYFDDADLPIILYYTNEEGHADLVKPPTEQTCLICQLASVRNGKSLCFKGDSVGCGGGKRYLGFVWELRPNFEYFLSCGIPGKMEGERYKKTPDMVKEVLKNMPHFDAPGEFVVFKRWDMLNAEDNPEVIIFFAPADVLSGLFTLASFDEVNPNGVFAPFSAGCGSIVQYPYLENKSENPRCVLGMFDVSARPCVPEEVLTFSVPIKKFLRMAENIPETFLITSSWHKVNRRIRQKEK